jgi:hypothetical protein
MGNEVSSSSGTSPGAEAVKVVERRNRNIKRMDQAVRRKLRGGVQFNMKVVIRGAPKTGKSSLWQRLQGKPLDPEYATTPEIQIAHINWAFKNMEEAVKVEVWDVVDVGRKPEAHDAASSTATPPPGPPPGGVSFGVLDASAVDVYQNAQAVIFMVNPTSAASFDYVAEQLSSEKFPRRLAVLVLVNFRDLFKKAKLPSRDGNEAGASEAAGAAEPAEAAKPPETEAHPPLPKKIDGGDGDGAGASEVEPSVAGEERKGSPEAGSDEASGADGGGVTESGEEGNSNGAEDIAKGDPKAGEIDASADGTSENAPESTDSPDSPPPAAELLEPKPALWLTAAIVEERLRQLPDLPAKLHVFDCSMENCFGLKILYSYLNVPFLELKKANLEQALRVLEEEAQATDGTLVKLVKSLTYDEYMEHLEKTKKNGSKGAASGPSAAQAPKSQAAGTDAPAERTAAESPSSSAAPEGKGTDAQKRGVVQKENPEKVSKDVTKKSTEKAAIDRKAKRKAKLELKHSAADVPAAPIDADIPDEAEESADVEDAIRFLNNRRSDNELEGFFSDDDEDEDSGGGNGGAGTVDDSEERGCEGSNDDKKNGSAKVDSKIDDGDTHAEMKGFADAAQEDDSDDEFYAPQHFGLVATTPVVEKPQEDNTDSTSGAPSPEEVPGSHESASDSFATVEPDSETAVAEPASTVADDSSDELDKNAAIPPPQKSESGDEEEASDVASERASLPTEPFLGDEFVAKPDSSEGIGDWLEDGGSSEEEGADSPAKLSNGGDPLAASVSEDENDGPAIDDGAIDDGAAAGEPQHEEEESLNQEDSIHEPRSVSSAPNQILSGQSDDGAPVASDDDDADEIEYEGSGYDRWTTRWQSDSPEPNPTTPSLSSAAQAAILAAMKAAEEEPEPVEVETRSKDRKKKDKKKDKKIVGDTGEEKEKEKKKKKKKKKMEVQ